MNFLNHVLIEGVVKSIDLDARDLIVESKTPRLGKNIEVKIHMWKTSRDNPNEAAFEGRPEWKDEISIGNSYCFEGHMGNNGRMICMGFGSALTCDYDD